MDVRNKQAVGVFITLTSFFMGLLFYLYYRPGVLAVDLHSGMDLPIWTVAAFPSFIFLPLISGISIITLRALNFSSNKNTVRSIVAWLAIVSLFEFLQATNLGYISRGTFDWFDITAAIFGAVVALIAFTPTISNQKTSAPIQSWKLVPILFLGVGAILGSIDEYCEGDNKHEKCLSQVILSWEDIRAEIQPDLSESEVLIRTGKINTLDHWLFVVEKYRGIHVFDTSDKLNPIRTMYIPIPGALDITIKDGILYSSAFTDLVTIDLNLLLLSDGVEISYSRQENIFEYPSTQQFYPDSYFSNYDQTPAKDTGIVIGYKTGSGKVVLYGDE